MSKLSQRSSTPSEPTSGPHWVPATPPTYAARFALVGGSKGGRTLLANVLRNLWAYVVIFCGHFPDGAAKFDPAVLEDETRGAWYLRQTLGSADFHAGPRRTPKRSCRDARGVPACVARSSGARCPARSPW